MFKTLNKDYFQKENYHFEVKLDKFCFNRYDKGLAFTAQVGIFHRDKEIFILSPIIFLPKINKNEDETMQIVLKDICGIEAELPLPEWLDDFKAPGQTECDKQIEIIKSNINGLYNDLKLAYEERDKKRTCLKLLYEREYVLEPATRTILRELGAHVEDPEEPNKEDGWIVVKIEDKKFEGVLEIKSTKSDTFNEEGRKQLLDWIDRGRRLRSQNFKGIFIGNSAVDKPLNERPYPFSDSWQKNAKLSEICAITTDDLYRIFILKSNGNLNITKFWELLFSTNGIFDIKPLLNIEE